MKSSKQNLTLAYNFTAIPKFGYAFFVFKKEINYAKDIIRTKYFCDPTSILAQASSGMRQNVLSFTSPSFLLIYFKYHFKIYSVKMLTANTKTTHL